MPFGSSRIQVQPDGLDTATFTTLHFLQLFLDEMHEGMPQPFYIGCGDAFLFLKKIKHVFISFMPGAFIQAGQMKRYNRTAAASESRRNLPAARLHSILLRPRS